MGFVPGIWQVEVARDLLADASLYPRFELRFSGMSLAEEGYRGQSGIAESRIACHLRRSFLARRNAAPLG